MTPVDAGRDVVLGGSRRDGAGPVVLHTASPGETRSVGAALAAVLRVGDVVLVAGELGAGKTTLVQGIASGLGVTDIVTSPTFTLVRPYPCERPSSPETSPSVMLHADLYRLDRLGEVSDLALGELVEDSAVAVVEWGDVAEPVLGRDALHVRLDTGTAEADRCITIAPSGSWISRRRPLEVIADTWGKPGTGRAG